MVAGLVVLSWTVWAQSPAPKATNTKDVAFDPKNLTGKYHRETPFQTYSNVPGGANELQAYILGQANAPES